MAEQRRQMPRLLWVLIILFASIAVAVALGRPLVRGVAEQWTSLGIAKAKSKIDDAQSVLPRRNGSEPATVTAEQEASEDADHQQSQPTDKPTHVHSEGTDAGEKADPETESEGKGHSEEGEFVELSAAQVKEFGIELAVAEGGPIATQIERPAEVKFDGDRVVHVVSRVEGVVRDVTVSQGENIVKDAVMAVLDSRELAELKANYLAAFERLNLARETFERESRLWEKKISSEKEYLDAKSALAEAEIAVRGAGQKLKALGFSEEFMKTMATTPNIDLTKYSILAPLSGTIVERHIGLGEAVSTDKEAFVIADVSTVWIDITIYPQDLPVVQAGQKVTIDLGHGKPTSGTIAFVSPQVREETRTAIARVITDNAGGRLKPGMFVEAQIGVSEKTTAVRVPKTAVQNYEDGQVVFVQESEKFEPRRVKLGRENSTYVEVLSGLKEGETYIAVGAFTLKAQLSKASFADGHNH